MKKSCSRSTWHREAELVQASIRKIEDGSSNLPGVSGSMVTIVQRSSTRVCGPRDAGSTPAGHLSGGMAQSGRRASFRYSLLRVRIPLPPFISGAAPGVR